MAIYASLMCSVLFGRGRVGGWACWVIGFSAGFDTFPVFPSLSQLAREETVGGLKINQQFLAAPRAIMSRMLPKKRRPRRLRFLALWLLVRMGRQELTNGWRNTAAQDAAKQPGVPKNWLRAKPVVSFMWKFIMFQLKYRLNCQC